MKLYLELMKVLNKCCFIILILLVGCSKKDEVIRDLQSHNSRKFSFLSTAETYYKANGMTLTLQYKPLEMIISKQQFKNDSIYKACQNALAKNIYFGLTIKPETTEDIVLPQLDVNGIISSTYLLNSGDTLRSLDVSVLQDFGLSKRKQFLIVFPNIKEGQYCNAVISIGGIFNAFDRYEFEFNAEDFN